MIIFKNSVVLISVALLAISFDYFASANLCSSKVEACNCKNVRGDFYVEYSCNDGRIFHLISYKQNGVVNIMLIKKLGSKPLEKRDLDFYPELKELYLTQTTIGIVKSDLFTGKLFYFLIFFWITVFSVSARHVYSIIT